MTQVGEPPKGPAAFADTPLRSFVLSGRTTPDLADLSALLENNASEDYLGNRMTRQSVSQPERSSMARTISKGEGILRSHTTANLQQSTEPELPPTPLLLMRRGTHEPRDTTSSRPEPRARRYRRRGGVTSLEAKHSDLSGSRLIQQRPNFRHQQLVEVLRADADPALTKLVVLRHDLSGRLQRLRHELGILEQQARRNHRMTQSHDMLSLDLSSFIDLLNSPADAGQIDAHRSTTRRISKALSYLLPFTSLKSANEPLLRHSLHTHPHSHVKDDHHDSMSYQIDPLFLKMFAPLVLSGQVSTELEVSADSNVATDLVQIQTVTLAAPTPMPPHVHMTTLLIVSGFPFRFISSIEISSPTTSTMRYPELHTWLRRKLSDPVCDVDISSTFWGINRHWECVLKRARFWRGLEQSHPDLLENGQERDINCLDTHSRPKVAETNVQEPRVFLRHLARNTMKLATQRPREDLSLQPDGSRPISLSIEYLISLDTWTCEAESEVNMYIHGISYKAEHRARSMFSVVKAEIGLRPAVEGLIKILFGKQ